jgi:hypothetical protein
MYKINLLFSNNKMDKEVFKLLTDSIFNAERIYGRKTGKTKRDYVKSFFPDMDDEVFNALLEGLLSVPIIREQLSKLHSKLHSKCLGCFK